MKVVTPLDRQSIIAIPSALEGKFYLGGPYELGELLREPDEYGDEGIDWRIIEIAQANGVQMRSACVDVACGSHTASVSEWPGIPTCVRYALRYLYRDDANSPITGVVELKVVHEIHGVQKRFEVGCKKVIHTVYVEPSSRGRGIARVLLAEVLSDAPDACVHPQFSEDGARLFGFDQFGNRDPYKQI
ncbi:GNAT family N-acetyltransferase [Burkholderia sp. BCC0405]|uniref:GNAT family N-acetyltransferase n=1 Tax=Burkholderia sp. BCC0405 TaxID=2676298 RepID=UPI00158D65A6|nr:GNAT family N-acetyltransferase [Burkholderia sp. BCC0405]